MTLTTNSIVSASSPVYEQDGKRIRLMVTFREFGQPIPFTACEQDDMDYSRELYKRALAGEYGTIAPAPAKTSAQIQVEYTDLVQREMDRVARSKGYDDMKSAVTYADEPTVPKFQKEGQAFRAWRSQCWAYCYDQMDKVKAGQIAIPDPQTFLNGLPVLVMPE